MNTDDDLSTEPLVRIVCAAIRHQATGTVLCGVRHYDNAFMRPMIRALCGTVEAAREQGWYGCEDGFVTNTYEFVTREQAYVIAEAAGQLRSHNPDWGKRLYSESLY